MGALEDILMLEMKINKLRIEFDQYFGGLIKIPPFKLQDEIKRILRTYGTRKIHNTSLNFRYKNLVGRYVTYENMWQRHMRLVNEGTLKRGAGFSQVNGAKKKNSGSSNESPAEKLFKDLMQAKSGLKQDTSDIKVQNLQAMIEKQTAAIKAKYKCSSVEYKVVTEAGKAKVKAVPKK